MHQSSMEVGVLQYSKVYTALKTPFSIHSSLKGPFKLCSVTQRPMFFEFLLKIQKYATQRPHVLEYLIDDKFA